SRDGVGSRTFGAIAEFARDPGEPAELRPHASLTARGGIRPHTHVLMNLLRHHRTHAATEIPQGARALRTVLSSASGKGRAGPRSALRSAAEGLDRCNAATVWRSAVRRAEGAGACRRGGRPRSVELAGGRSIPAGQHPRCVAAASLCRGGPAVA